MNMSIKTLRQAITLGEMNLNAVTPEAKKALEIRLQELRMELVLKNLNCRRIK